MNEEAVEAAAVAIGEMLRSYGDHADNDDLGRAALAAALPLLRLSDVPGLERQLRDKIAGEAREFAEQWLYDGDRDRPLSGYLQVLDLAEQIARGASS